MRAMTGPHLLSLEPIKAPSVGRRGTVCIVTYHRAMAWHRPRQESGHTDGANHDELCAEVAGAERSHQADADDVKCERDHVFELAGTHKSAIRW